MRRCLGKNGWEKTGMWSLDTLSELDTITCHIKLNQDADTDEENEDSENDEDEMEDNDE